MGGGLGYEPTEAEAIVAVLMAAEERRVGRRELATWACVLELRARRAAIENAGSKVPSHAAPAWSVEELARLRGAPVAPVRRELGALLRHRLVVEVDGELRLGGADSVLEHEADEHARRVAEIQDSRDGVPVPVPRKVLRFLAAAHVVSVFQATLALVLRACWRTRTGGALKRSGTVLYAWVRDMIGLSRGAWFAALAFLEQHDIVRREAYRERHARAQWGVIVHLLPRSSAPAENGRHTRRATPKNGLSEGNTSQSSPKTASEKPDRRPATAGLYERIAPSLRDVRPEDLRVPERCEQLYRQAVDVGRAQPSEAGRLELFSMAAHALRVGRDACRLFVSNLLHRRAYIQQEDEDRALQMLRRLRDGSSSPALSEATAEERAHDSTVEEPAPPVPAVRGATYRVREILREREATPEERAQGAERMRQLIERMNARRGAAARAEGA